MLQSGTANPTNSSYWKDRRLLNDSITLIPFADDPLEAAAGLVFEHYSGTLPDLSRLVILLEEPSVSTRLRQLLITGARQRGQPALLGPIVTTLQDWIMRHYTEAAAASIESARQLVLLDAIKQHPKLFGHFDLWRLCTQLLTLFNELTLQQADIDADISTYLEQVREAYQLDEPGISHYSQEARLVHTLWHAWQQQLEAMHSRDNALDYVDALKRSLDRQLDGHQLLIVGATDLSRAEADWLLQVLQQGRGRLLLHGDPGTCAAYPFYDCFTPLPPAPAGNAVSCFFDTVFAYQQQNLWHRAQDFRRRFPRSAVAPLCSIFDAASSEQEAQAVALQISLWRQQGHRQIGVVIEDRKLARRVRALLERHGIRIQDLAGWTLSTTSVATVVEKWLECIETDFTHEAFLDLLKSPFLDLAGAPGITAALQRDTLLEAVYRLEQDIILHENVARGLTRYSRHIRYRHKRLHWSSQTTGLLLKIIEYFDEIRRPVLKLFRHGSHSAHEYLQALSDSLQALGIRAQLEMDEAGRVLLQCLAQMHHACEQYPLELSWTEFRAWLSHTLEHTHFNPSVQPEQIRLLSLAQARLMRFDCLVITSNEAGFIPGHPPAEAFFNNQARKELGLRDWEYKLGVRFHDYRGLLEAVPPEPAADGCRLLFSRRVADNGEEVSPSPWLEAIQTFHRQVYGDGLENRQLAALLTQKRHTGVKGAETGDYAQASIPPALVPTTFTASSHQQLIDCPYLYFCARVLKLQASDEIREILSKADYGHRVHLCLQAFHTQVAQLPPPFTERITAHNRQAAEERLREISREVFRRDLEDNFQHRAWLQRWLASIPSYIDWEISRQQDFEPIRFEADMDRRLHGISLRGRLDRIDQDARKQLGVVDYKSGSIPAKKDILLGEATQLVTYALLTDQVERVEYLVVDTETTNKHPIDGEELARLKQQTASRLLELHNELLQGRALPAWGDSRTCSHCAMQGICRRQLRG